MRIRLFAFGLVFAASLWGQKHFSWQDACFKNPGAPYCQGHDYAVKKQQPSKASPTVVTNPGAATPRTPTPSLIVVGGIDWRFADPFADALVGINFSALSRSPIARNLIAQLGTSQGLAEADLQKIVAGLSGVDQIAVSVRDNRMVVLVTGRVTDTLPSPEAGLKVTLTSGNAMLIGHPEAVDQAIQRIAMKGPLSESARSAEERQASSEFWVIGSPRLLGPQAISEGVKRFSLAASIRDQFSSDMAFEFDRVPSAATMRQWPATFEGNVAHIRMSMEAGEVSQKFAPIVASPIGQRLAVLVQAAKYLPVPDPTVPKRAKPMIYGLDGGPKEVN